jgi:hypothetical protein
MSVTLLDYSVDVLTRIIRCSNLDQTCLWWRVSKTVQDLIRTAANQKQMDFDFDDKEVEYNCTNLKSLLYLKIKIQKFTMDPKFFKSLGEMTAQPAFEKPKDVLALWGFATESYAQMLTLVIFDFTTKKLTGKDLGMAFKAVCTYEESDDEDSKEEDPAKAELINAVFMHPNADAIELPALLSVFSEAVKDENDGQIEKVLNHRNVIQTSIGKFILSAIHEGDDDLAQKLLERPKANEIPAKAEVHSAAIYPDTALQELINEAVGMRMYNLVFRLLDHPNAKDLPEDYLSQLLCLAEVRKDDLLDRLQAHSLIKAALDSDEIDEPPCKRRRTDQ